MPFSDKERQRLAVRDATRRYRARKRGAGTAGTYRVQVGEGATFEDAVDALREAWVTRQTGRATAAPREDRA